MYASFLRLRLDPRRIDHAKRVWHEQVFPSVGEIEGREGTLFALDDARGKAVSAGFWPDEQAARTLEPSGKLRRAFKPLEPLYEGAPARVVYPMLTSEGISVGGEAPEATVHPGEKGAPAH